MAASGSVRRVQSAGILSSIQTSSRRDRSPRELTQTWRESNRRFWAYAALLLCLVAADASAQTVNTLLSFDITNGQEPNQMSLVQGLDGNLYGTTSGQGLTVASSTGGTVFKITPAAH